ncbi:Carbon-nitrogen hydrolase [Handroanthus impetiginosus]|uniref:Carbon-nitrogen hydrolase n=1 Tax=Handroanthus impetiginosus TaxID=429701 RepID=A0A2G9GFR9_9LAMI|nr:Carbon-nitrogen hydrolase [Handroanthus impetiginosus]
MCNCPYSTDYCEGFTENFDDQDSASSSEILSEVACQEEITIVGGSMPEWSEGHLHNTCCLFAPNGWLLAKHRKIHMVNVDIPGDISFNGSDTYSVGRFMHFTENYVGRSGRGICHDIRFPQLAMVYRYRGFFVRTHFHLICYRGAFTISTGEALWKLEQRAKPTLLSYYFLRLLYVTTCSPSRDSAGSHRIWGHSTLVNLLGEVIATLGQDETIEIAEVDYAATQRTR